MKVGIITFHNASNYGAVLQTYALQEAIRNICSNAEIINYKNPFIMKGLKRVRTEASLHGIYYTINDILTYRKRIIKIKRFHDFFENYYTLSKLMDKSELKQAASYDVAVSGSDQIWNPLLNHEVDDIYFLQMKGIKKRISYSSSIGTYKFDNALYNEKIKNYLSQYKQITVRENMEIMRKFLGVEVREMCDPTLLLNEQEWREKLSVRKSDAHYLLVYALSDFERVFSVASTIAQKKNLKICSVGDVPLKYQRRAENYSDAGPKEFIELFLNTSYVVTNSFHGTVFAVNFKKQFVSVLNQKSPERAANFLQKVGLKERLIQRNYLMLDDISDSCYAGVEAELMKYKQYAEHYLKAELC